MAAGCASPNATTDAGQAASGNGGGAETTEATPVETAPVEREPDDAAVEEGPGDDSGEASTEGAPEELAIVDDADPLQDVVGCTLIDSETIEIELVNNSDVSSSYSMTIAYLDGAGQRVGDDSQYVESLRPTERAVEELYVWDEISASSCEVLAVDRWEDRIDASAVADVPSCQVTGTDSWGDVEASLDVTNNGSDAADYSVVVGFFDGDGVRRGTGSAFVDVVRPGESAPSDVFTVVQDGGGYTCEVLLVDRTAS